MKKQIILLSVVASLFLTACVPDKPAVDKEPIDVSPMKESVVTSNDAMYSKEKIMDFSLNILKDEFHEENILISPVSIVTALGMVTNGADEGTLEEIKQAVGLTPDDMNDFLSNYKDNLPSDEKYKVSLANSIWYKDKKGLKIKPTFLDINEQQYGAGVYKVPFNEETKNEINAWVKKETSGMIEGLLEQSPPEDAIMYLINALSFDAEWEEMYDKFQIHDGVFTTENNEQQDVEFMTSDEYGFLENEDVTGVAKPYKDGKYEFVVLLPKEGKSINDVIAKLTTKELVKMLTEKQDVKVEVTLPKFSLEYDTELNDTFKQLGINTMFDREKANFSKLGTSEDGNIYVDSILHKTRIEVGERGTKAGAVTAFTMMDAISFNPEPLTLYLDRPFIYMIIDTEQRLPLFIGSLMELK